MFITNETAKMAMPAALFDNDSSYWTHVKLHLHIPWFYCVYEEEYEDGKFRHMVLLSHPSQLDQISQMSRIVVVEVQVVLPAYMTGQDRWIMVPLASIWEGEAPGNGGIEHVYITVDGRRFCSNEKITEENQLMGKQLLYQSPLKQAS